jgi:phosphatidate cytidylyltransferase
MAGGETPAKKSDLGVRVASAVVMVAVAGMALWLGGWAWTAFVVAVAGGVLWEWWGLVRAFASGSVRRLLWLFGGIFYIGIAAMTIVLLREDQVSGWLLLLVVLLAVIGTDIGAYFAGRTIGGPKIAPRISPSKTWAGLVGGAMAAGIAVLVVTWSWHSGLCEILNPPFQDPMGNRFQFDGPCSFGLPPTPYLLISSILAGAVIAVLAQAGDFFESWMKRRAGVKDSGALLPGHGGLFDRADGLIAVLFVLGLFSAYSFLSSL